MKLKKILPVWIVICSIGLLSSCGKDKTPSLDDRINAQAQVRDSFEGTLKAVDSFQYYQGGTHQLETFRDGVILLQSRTIDLSKYLNQDVKVEGEMEKGLGEVKPVFSVTKISYLNQKAIESKSLYENKNFGFRFKHPSSWLVLEVGSEISLSLEERRIVHISVFSDQTNLSSFASSKESGAPVEVTVASQKTLRYGTGEDRTFYVANPPKEKIYQIQFTPDQDGDLEGQKTDFYAFLKSFELIYISTVKGKVCGGEPPVDCPENFVCELKSGDEFAEGSCIPVGANVTADSCPYISPPVSCDEYRISDYSPNGCPSLYTCISGGGDLSVSVQEGDQVSGQEGEVENSSEGFDEAEESSDSGQTYVVPPLSKVTGLYSSDRLGITLNYPNSWYYSSFGAIDGTLGKVGFADKELEVSDQSIITMSVSKKDGGKASKKIGDLYYVFDGPDDLTEVMEEMAKGVEAN